VEAARGTFPLWYTGTEAREPNASRGICNGVSSSII
jgi:hypothetical protein